jgi:hypothetical protein
MGIWSEYLACSHPDVPVDLGTMPEEMRDLLGQHGGGRGEADPFASLGVTRDAVAALGVAPLRDGTKLGDIFKGFCDACRIWGYMDDAYLSKWRVTMEHISQRADGAPVWIMFLCREHDRVFWLRWRGKCLDVASDRLW